MTPWQVRLRLKFRGVPWRLIVGFDYEWKAWLIAYEVAGVTPEGFNDLDVEKQKNLLAYGAAAWHLIKRRKKVYFTPGDIAAALLKITHAESLELSRALSYARFPDWLPQQKEGKKKA